MTSNTQIDTLIRTVAFGATDADKRQASRSIREMAAAAGVVPASIHDLYMAAGQGRYSGITVPAINIRGICYDVARAVFRAINKNDVWACIFELARSEMQYTAQPPDEYVVAVMAAALREGYTGPVFIQVDHTQVKNKVYAETPQKEMDAIKALVKEAIQAGFYNIDIDASTLVDISKSALEDQQDKNSAVTAELTKYIRGIQPAGITISVGGEIGEIGHGNSTVADMDAFMTTYYNYLGEGIEGTSKLSVQTGTSHGGVVLPDGTLADVSIDFETLKNISKAAKEKYHMGGAVQHGASTLPDDAFDMFPKMDTLEVHLATGFQNIIYDSPAFPAELLDRIRKDIVVRYADEKKEKDSEEQFIYKTRKKSFGDFKKELWSLPEASNKVIMDELEERFSFLFAKLNALKTKDLVKEYVKY